MLDTIRLRSPWITAKEAALIAQSCKRRECVDIATGEVEYSLTTGSLSGSYDDRVSVRIETEEWCEDGNGSKVCKVPCDPYLLIEGSVHKALLGHNVYGGPNDPVAACRWFISDLSRRLEIELPNPDEWIARRIDWSEVYDMGSFEAVQEYLHALNTATFPRRSVIRYADECVFAPGKVTTIKAYHKGPEFWKHDRMRLKNRLDCDTLNELQEQANRLLRVEVSVKARKLDEEYGGKGRVVDLTRDFLEEVHDREASRLIREGQAEMKTVRTNSEVVDRLHAVYEARLARTLYATWVMFAGLGESEVKKRMSRPTFYRQRKQLEEAGVSWFGSDVVIAKHSAIPEGFRPFRTDPRRLVVEAPVVIEKLLAYREEVYAA